MPAILTLPPVFVGAHAGDGSVMNARYRATSANTDGRWSAPQRSPPQLTTPSWIGADAGPVQSGPPLSPLQPEYSGARPSASIEQRMRGSKRSSVEPR